MEIKENDLVLCKVEKVTPVVTFVSLPDGRKGTIISSEIAPGRIKFMRKYVVPNKLIVCKVLKVSGDKIDLSLRRVSAREQKEVLSKFKQEQANKLAFKQLLKEDYEKTIEKIQKDYKSITEFINEARTNPEILERYIRKDKIESVKKLTEKKRKKSELRYLINLQCLEEGGLERIKRVLDVGDKVSLSYLSAGSYMLKMLVDDFKEGKKKINSIIEEIERRAKKNHCTFNFKEIRN